MTKRKDPKDKVKVGRKSLYKSRYCKELVDYMKEAGDPVYKHSVSNGSFVKTKVGNLPHYLSAFARKIGVAFDTLNEWTRVHPKFSDAYKTAVKAQEEMLASGTLAGIYAAAGGIFALKNLHRWKDRQELSGDPDHPVGMVLYIPEEDKG